MTHKFAGVYIYGFTPTEADYFIVRCSEPLVYKTEDGIAFSVIDEFDKIDATISSRLASADYTIPDNANISNILNNTTTINNTIDTIDDKIDIIDTNIDSVDTKINTINTNANDAATGVFLLNTKLTSTRSSKLDNLDAKVSTRSVVTDDSIWSYTNRKLSSDSYDGVGSCAVTVDITISGVVAEDVNVIVYDSSRVALLSAISDVSGQVIFNLDPENYIFEFKKSSVAYAKEIKRTIPSVASINLDACASW